MRSSLSPLLEVCLLSRLLAEEGEQGLVDVVSVGPEQAVWGAFDLDVVGVRQMLGELPGGGVDRQDTVAGAVQDERGHVDLGDVGAEVGEPAVDNRRRREPGSAGGDIPAAAYHSLADTGTEVLVEVVEVTVELVEPGIPIGLRRGL